jgi:hypothetical protein
MLAVDKHSSLFSQNVDVVEIKMHNIKTKLKDLTDKKWLPNELKIYW